jgi:hypothetical protein
MLYDESQILHRKMLISFIFSAKLQSEVHTLREEVHNFRASRADFSKNVLQEARARLEALQHSVRVFRTSR